MKRFPSTLVAILMLSTACARTAAAQSIEGRRTVTVTTAAPVFLLPDNHRIPLQIATEGSILLFVRTEGAWYHIEFDDPVYGRRSGYIETQYGSLSADPRTLHARDLSVQEAPGPPPESLRAELPRADARRPTPRPKARPQKLAPVRLYVFTMVDSSGFVDEASVARVAVSDGVGYLLRNGKVARVVKTPEEADLTLEIIASRAEETANGLAILANGLNALAGGVGSLKPRLDEKQTTVFQYATLTMGDYTTELKGSGQTGIVQALKTWLQLNRAILQPH